MRADDMVHTPQGHIARPGGPAPTAIPNPQGAGWQRLDLQDLPASMLPAVLDDAGVAARLRCAPKTVAEWARTHRLPGLKVSCGWVFPTDALLRCLNARADENFVPLPVPALVAALTSSPPGKRRRPLPKLIDLC